MADPPSKDAKGGKILGMPRTTGLVVIGLAAVVAGLFLVSYLGKGKGGGNGGGGGGGGYGPGPGQSELLVTIKDWQGHRHKRHPVNPGGPRQ